MPACDACRTHFDTRRIKSFALGEFLAYVFASARTVATKEQY